MATKKKPRKARTKKAAQADPNERTPQGGRIKTGVETVAEEQQRTRTR